MNAEEFSQKMSDRLGSALIMVAVYGSAAEGQTDGQSDVNLLVVCDELGEAELNALAEITPAWEKKKNPPPLLFTKNRLLQSLDVFPLELLDIKQCHKVLKGEDLLTDLEVPKKFLLWQLEHEMKGKLIQLRESFLSTGAKPKYVLELMMGSIGTFFVLFRGLLRCFEDAVPTNKLESAKILEKHLEADMSVFYDLMDARKGVKKIDKESALIFYYKYLKSVEAIVDQIDGLSNKLSEKDVK